MSELVLTERDGDVLVVSLNRTKRKNAINLVMYTALADAMAEAEADRSIRALLFRANGDTFCAGNDLMDFVQNPPKSQDSPVFRFLSCMLNATKPLVAAVNGAAVGIGTTMLLHCDLVYASSTARFKMPFVPLALVPEAGSSLLLPRLAGHALASELLLLGETFDVATALRAGIVSREIEGDVEAHALAQAHKLAALPPGALQTTKSLLKRSTRTELAETVDLEAGLFIERLASAETAEAVSAFFEKRKPDFSKF